MLHFDLLRDRRILIVTPEGPLQSDDFRKLAEAVDPLIAAEGDLTGLLIDAPHFPGWQSFGDLVSHFRFVKNHVRHIRKVAVVSDSGFLSILPSVATHFVHAEVKHFEGGEKARAMAWIAGEQLDKDSNENKP